MTVHDEIAQEISGLRSLPLRSRVASAETIALRADALGDEDLMGAIRIELITAYLYSTDVSRIFLPFTWLLTRYDEKAPWFGAAEQRSLFWSYKWMVDILPDFPQVPRLQLESTVDGMERRYRDNNEGLAPVLMCRYMLRAHIDGAASAAEEYRAWVMADRTTFSDCQACEPSRRSEHWAELGHHERAVAEVEQVLSGQLRCGEQPQWAISVTVESRVEIGDLHRAAAEHRRGVRISRTKPDEMAMMARHIRLCARSQQLVRGLDLLVERLPGLSQPPSPRAAMELAAAGGRLLSAWSDSGRGDFEVTVAGRPVSVATLGDELVATALDLAGQFDRRNGTGTVGRRVRDWLTASELPALPLGASGTARTVRHQTSPSDGPGPSGPGLPRRTEPVPLDPMAWLDRLNHRGDGAAAIQAAVLSEWAVRGGEEAPADQLLAAARLDVELAGQNARLDQQADRPPREDHTLLRRAVRRFRAAERPDLAALAEQDYAGRRFDLDAVVGAVSAIDLLTVDPDVRARARSAAGSTLLRRHRLTAEPADLAEAERLLCEAISLTAGVGPADAEERRLHAAQALVLTAPGDDPSNSQRALELIRPGERSEFRVSALMQLARLLPVADQRETWDEAVSAAERSGSVAVRAQAHLQRGRWLHGTDPAGSGIADLTTAVQLFDELGGPFWAATGRLHLAEALDRAGQTVDAADAAEGGLQLLRFSAPEEGSSWLERERTQRFQHSQLQLYALATGLAADLHEHARTVKLADEFLELLAPEPQRKALASVRRWMLGARAETLMQRAHALAEFDTRRAVPAYADAIEAATEVGSDRLVLIALRARIGPAAEAGGLDAGLAAVDRAMAAQDDYESMMLVDPDRSNRLGAWSFEAERLSLQTRRTHLLGGAGDFERAFAAQAGVAEEWTRLGFPRQAELANILRGQLHLDLGQSEVGIAVLISVAERTHQLGDAEVADEALSTLYNWLESEGRSEEAEALWQRFNPAD